MKKFNFWIPSVIFGLIFTMCSTEHKDKDVQSVKSEQVTISEIGFDPYAKDCDGGISVVVKSAQLNIENVGKSVFIKPADQEFTLPTGLIPAGDNDLIFYGDFSKQECIHLMGDDNTPSEELYFIYDSVAVKCPYKYFKSETMQFDSQTCGKHESFHDRIIIIE